MLDEVRFSRKIASLTPQKSVETTFGLQSQFGRMLKTSYDDDPRYSLTMEYYQISVSELTLSLARTQLFHSLCDW